MSETVPTANGTVSKKFDGDGVPFKGKLIGMEDLSIDRDEKVCLDSMFKLKAVVSARGEHKQKVQVNLTMTAVKVFDDTTKVQLASHEIHRISFVVLDPRDPRAFGYIYNTSDDRHQFWAIKTERPAAYSVLALKELFELVFEQITNTEKVKGEENPPEKTDLAQQPSLGSTSVSTPQPTVSPPEPMALHIQPPEPVVLPSPEPVALPPPPSQTTVRSVADAWGEKFPITTVQSPQASQKRPEPIIDLWDMDEPIVPVTQPAPTVLDPMADMFDLLPSSITTATNQQSANDDFLSMFTTTTTNTFVQPSQPPSFQPLVSTPLIPQQQPNFLGSPLISPIAPSTVTSQFSEFDFLG